ncbi:hypothetical protein [Streptomyces sp. NPDC051219]|uniref:hypothetical protein n=1 Tax=Streptomyces sp. NPDC051219 TaxID=3155283 RepID=UPI003414515A
MFDGSKSRLPARGLAVCASALALALGVPGAPSAQAAAPCAGRLVKTVPFATGQVHVYKTRTHACAVTISRRPGVRRQMSVSIQPRGGRAVKDSGRFTRMAGPVTVHAVNRCVRVTGSVGSKSAASGWILC